MGHVRSVPSLDTPNYLYWECACEGDGGQDWEDWEVSNVTARTSTNIQRQFPFRGKYYVQTAWLEPSWSGDHPSVTSGSEHDDW